jgi:hypothetical protein
MANRLGSRRDLATSLPCDGPRRADPREALRFKFRFGLQKLCVRD